MERDKDIAKGVISKDLHGKEVSMPFSGLQTPERAEI